MFKEYPKTLYLTIDEFIIVSDNEEEIEAIGNGYKLHSQLFEKSAVEVKEAPKSGRQKAS